MDVLLIMTTGGVEIVGRVPGDLSDEIIAKQQGIVLNSPLRFIVNRMPAQGPQGVQFIPHLELVPVSQSIEERPLDMILIRTEHILWKKTIMPGSKLEEAYMKTQSPIILSKQ